MRIKEFRMGWEYFSGYFDGEGCLLFSIIRDGRSDKLKHNKGAEVHGWNIIPQLSLQTGDYEVLNNMYNFLQNKNIDVAKMDIKKRRENQTKDFKRLSIYGWDNILKTIRYILPYSISKKQQLILFEEVFSIRKKQKIWTRDNFLKCMAVIDKINSYKGHYRNNIKTYSFFNKLWGSKNAS